MISSVSRGDSRRMEDVDFYRALTILEETEKKMDRAFGMKGEYELYSMMEKVGVFLVKNYKDERRVTAFSEIMKRFYRDCSKMNMEIVLDTLNEMKEVTWKYCEQRKEKIYKPEEWYIKEKEKFL